MHSIVRCSTEDAVSTIVHGPWPMPHGLRRPAAADSPSRPSRATIMAPNDPVLQLELAVARRSLSFDQRPRYGFARVPLCM